MKPYQYSREADIEARRRLYGAPPASDENAEGTVLFAIFCVATTALALVLFSGVQL